MSLTGQSVKGDFHLHLTRKHSIAVAAIVICAAIATIIYIESQDRAWSPDGQWIAFQCVRAGNYENDEIYRVRPDGSATERLTDNNRHNGAPAWSPDAAWILFVSHSPTDRNDDKIYRMRPDGSEAAPLVDKRIRVAAVDWAVAGNWIGFIYEGDVYKMRPDGKDVSGITSYGMSVYGIPAVRNLAWSPDGEWISYERYVDGRSDIYRIHPDGTGEERLTFSQEDNRSPSWSPDSRWIVFASGGNIYRMAADGQELTTLVQGTNLFAASMPSYSPDGQWIVYTGRLGNGFSQIYKIRVDGSENTQLTEVQCYASDPAWSPLFRASE